MCTVRFTQPVSCADWIRLHPPSSVPPDRDLTQFKQVGIKGTLEERPALCAFGTAQAELLADVAGWLYYI